MFPKICPSKSGDPQMPSRGVGIDAAWDWSIWIFQWWFCSCWCRLATRLRETGFEVAKFGSRICQHLTLQNHFFKRHCMKHNKPTNNVGNHPCLLGFQSYGALQLVFLFRFWCKDRSAQLHLVGGKKVERNLSKRCELMVFSHLIPFLELAASLPLKWMVGWISLFGSSLFSGATC